jgi:hypothetical protein
MRVKKNRWMFKFVAPLFVTAVFFVFNFNFARAEKISFGQSILPVKFIYLDKYGNIEKIWTNIDESSEIYIMKFYKNNGASESLTTGENIQSYKKVTINNNYFLGDNFAELKVDFLEKSGKFEEILTYA